MGGVVPRVEQVMGVGSLAFAAGGLLAPAPFGRASGVSPATARLLGARDLVVAALRQGRGGSLGLVARGVSDVGDAVLLARRRPRVAAFAGASGAVNLLAAVRARRCRSAVGATTPAADGAGA